MIFVSTGGVPDHPASDTASALHRYGISAVELSGGAPSPTQEAALLRLRHDVKFQVHNYFPPPADPFVFNLASSNHAVLQRGVEHVRSAMRLAVALERPVYSFHAGFRMDPQVSQLGTRIDRSALVPRHTALQRFGETMSSLADEAAREGVMLLIENNVLSAANLKSFGENPLLLTSPDEIEVFMSEMPAHIGLLLDVAHLKVSATSLGFDLRDAHERVRPWIRGYHLSDNDGTVDSNQPVTPASWFWELIDPNLDYYSLEVHGVSFPELARQYEFVKTLLANIDVCDRADS